MNRVTVFGGSGFLGSYVVDELIRRNYDVLVADIVEPSNLNGTYDYLKCDIMDMASINEAVKNASFVYNFAGLADLDESIHNPQQTFELNVSGNLNILEACKELALKRFVYASSAYAFSNKGSFYGISKLASEKIVAEYYQRFSIPFTIIRYGSIYGERADSHNGVYKMLREAIETGAIYLRGDGEEVREYTHAADAAILSVDIIGSDEFINEHTILTGFERLRKRDLLMMIKEILNNNIEISFSDEPWEGHYQITPYSYHPNVARKLVSNSFIDLGQGLVSCIKHIHDEIESE